MNAIALANTHFEFDAQRRCLSSAGACVQVEPKVAEVLDYLIQHPHRVISRDELLDGVWGDLPVMDESLTRCISILRRTLHDRRPFRFIATHSKHGYQFVGDVRLHPGSTTRFHLIQRDVEQLANVCVG